MYVRCCMMRLPNYNTVERQSSISGLYWDHERPEPWRTWLPAGRGHLSRGRPEEALGKLLGVLAVLCEDASDLAVLLASRLDCLQGLDKFGLVASSRDVSQQGQGQVVWADEECVYAWNSGNGVRVRDRFRCFRSGTIVRMVSLASLT